MSCLLVILPFRLSSIIEKGEVTARYFNPQNLFEEVHILLTNGDKPDLKTLQKMVGNARLYLHNYPFRAIDWVLTAGMRPVLMNHWARGIIPMVESIRPDVVRCHGAGVNAWLAVFIRRRLGIPFAISLHNHPSDNRKNTPWTSHFTRRLILELSKSVEQGSLEQANRIIVVYQSLLDYAQTFGKQKVQLIYNVVNADKLSEKVEYTLNAPAQIISVGQQIHRKNPEMLIRAIKDLPVHLTIVGDGPLHQALVNLAEQLKLGGKIDFVKSISNDELCYQLTQFDVFAIYTGYPEIPKAVIEPLLAGLPVIINRKHSLPVPELEGDWVYGVESNPEAYKQALEDLINNDSKRAGYGKRGKEYAREKFAPKVMEKQLYVMYKDLIMDNKKSSLVI